MEAEKKLLGRSFSTHASPFRLPSAIAGQTANTNTPEGASADCQLSGFTATTGQAAHHSGLFSGRTLSF